MLPYDVHCLVGMWHIKLNKGLVQRFSFGYSVQLKNGEPSTYREDEALCVVQGQKMICKHDYIENMLIPMMSILIWLLWPTQP
jgi:hypothetical protein